MKFYLRILVSSVLIFLFVSCESVPESENTKNELQSSSPVVAANTPAKEQKPATKTVVKTVQKTAKKPATKAEQKSDAQKPAQVAKVEAPAAVVGSSAANETEVDFVSKVGNALRSGDMDGALNFFAEMPEEFKADKDLNIVHASILVSAGKLNEARDIVATLEKSNKNDLDILELKMNIASVAGDTKAQNAAMQSILAIDPYNAPANIRQAENYVRVRKYQMAANSYLRALRNDDKNSEALFGYAQMCYYLNNIKEAEKYLAKLIEAEPNNAYAIAYMGKLEAEDENYLRALGYINRAIEIDSSNYDFYIDQGTYERYLGHPDAAIKAWTTAINLNPDYFLAYTYRAGIYDEKNRFAEALADYHNVARTNPQYYFAYEQIGVLEWHEQNWSVCRNAFQEALKYSPNNFAYILMVAATYLKEKKPMDMKNYLSKALRAFKNDSLEYQLIRLYHDQGPTISENNVMNSITKEQNSTKRGKMRYYLALYYELKGIQKISEEIYAQIVGMTAPMFFEYRMAEWALGQ